MPAAGCFGFGEVYDNLIDPNLFGAIVTQPLSYRRRRAGTRATIPLPAGCLIEETRANPGLSGALTRHRARWEALPVPLIVHLVASDASKTRKAASRLDEETSIRALELGLPEDCDRASAHSLVNAARRRFEKPLLVRLPLLGARFLAASCAGAGADALVIAAPPQGVAREAESGRLVHGNLYGPWVKALVWPVLRALREWVDLPIIAAGGVHSLADARDYLAAGASALQVDSLIWRDPLAFVALAKELNAELAPESGRGTSAE